MQSSNSHGDGHLRKEDNRDTPGAACSRHFAYSPAPPSVFSRAGDSPMSFSPQLKTYPQSIDLQAVLSSGPHEMEAETHILRAVEKIIGQDHHVDKGMERLYATIAEDGLTRALEDGDFIPLQENEGQRMDGVKGDTDTNVPTSNRDVPPPALDSSSKLKLNSLVQQTLEASKNSHVSIEQTLFGYSNALAQMGQASQRRSSFLEDFDTPLRSADKVAAAMDEQIKEEMGIAGDEEQGGGNSDDTSAVASDTEQFMTESEGTGDETKSKKKRRQTVGARKLVSTAASGLRDDFDLFNEFLGGKKQSAKSYARAVLFFTVLPSLAVSFLLFYFVEKHETDPTTGEIVPGQDASVSWWLLFVGVRLVITLTMALMTQALVIDYLALGSRFSLRWFGPIVTLLVVQSKGWPFVSIFWGAYNLILLAGDKPYVKHWLYWQDVVGWLNSDNPGGNILDSETYHVILRLMIIIGVIVSVKRLAVGLMLGRQTFSHFGQELATVMKNMVLIGEVATLAREIEKDSKFYASLHKYKPDLGCNQAVHWAAPSTISDFVKSQAAAALEEEKEFARENVASQSAADAAIDFINKRKTEERTAEAKVNATMNSDELGGEFTASEQVEISKLLDAWEEPTRAEDSEQRKITIGAVMQFRQALTFMTMKYPFLPAFGRADSREKCIESSQAVFERLLMRTPNESALPFESLALLAKDDKGGINQDKAKELIRIFRPERDGSIGKLEFVKSVDGAYKQLRLLSANIRNSSQIDKAIESLVNIVFYVILGCYVLSALGSNPSAIFFSFSSVILGFAFMFGASSAKYFEGLLFILVQRPYGVGDRIHLSNPQNETVPQGSSFWIVEKVTLTTTTVRWGTTNEVSTLSNGAIADLRVINGARSPNATLFVDLKFGIDTPYEKIAIFRAAVEQFLKERPREWLTFIGFRPAEVAVDRGFIGYRVIAQHRNHWQAIGGILESKANLTTYCLEVAKQLEMRYHAPPLPVGLTFNGKMTRALESLQGTGTDGLDQTRIAKALHANRERRGSHQAFSEGVE